MFSYIYAVCICSRHQPAGADRAGQTTVQLSRDRGGHLQQTWSSGPEESVAGRHPDTGNLKYLHSQLDLSIDIYT